jgi:hypothetical protein
MSDFFKIQTPGMDDEEFSQLMNSIQATPPPAPEKRSAMGEIWSQLKAGTFSDLPRMAGRAMQYVSSPGNNTYETGKGLVEDANAIATLPEMQPGDTTGRPVIDALSKGARMIPQSIAPAVGAGLVLSGAGAPAGVALIGGSALAAAPAGLAQAQDTYEKGLAKHGLTAEQAAAMPDDPRVQEAVNAGRMTGAFEWGGETAGGALAGRFMGIGGNMAKSAIGRILNKGEQSAAQATLRSFTNPGAFGKFAGNALETAGAETLTEIGQGAAEAAVEQHYGYDQQTPWNAAKEAIAPTLGMTALLLPFGIPAHASHTVKMNAITSILANPDIAPESRRQAAEIIYNELAKQSPDAATNFAAHSFDAIHGDQETGSAPYGMTLDDSVLHPLIPRALQEQQQSEPIGPISRALTAMPLLPAVSEPQPGMPRDLTGLLEAPAPVMQPIEPVASNAVDEQPVNHFTAPAIQESNPTEPAAYPSPVQTQVIPADSLHGTLQHFIKIGLEKTVQSGQTVNIWDKPNKPLLDKAVSDYLQPAAEQGLVSRDSEGVYNVQTDRGALRILPPTEAKGNYRLEYHSTSNAENFTPAANQRTPKSLTTIETQAHEAATSPHNDIAEPTQAQIEAGNYKKGHIKTHGLDISIENPEGSTRKGIDENGKSWETRLKHHYGYIKGTMGSDKDHIDVFIGHDQRSDKIFVVDQINPKTKAFDEHKILIGFGSHPGARDGYLSNYDKSGSKRIGAITETTPDEFKQWLKEENTRKPFADRRTQTSFTITSKAVAAAFPGQTITQNTEGHTIALKNGATVKITSAGDILFNVAAAEAAHGRKMKPGEKPVASFQALEHQAVITLTEQGAGEIHHEVFHSAMELALNKNQRAAILKTFKTEEAAAAEYQRLKESGAFEQKRQHHLFLQTIYNFFAKIHTMLDPSRQIMKDVATGKVWDTLATAATPTPATVKYSLVSINDKATAVKKHLSEAANKSTFVKQDIAPAMKATGEGIAAAWDGIKAAVNPMARSAAAEETGRILIEGMGRMEHGKEKFINELNKATLQTTYGTTRLAKALDLMQSSTTLADKLFTSMTEKDRIAFMQNMDAGEQQTTKELQQVADAIKTMFEEKAKAVQALGTGALETVRENYFPHVWDRSDDARKEINTRLSKRPLEGSKGFSKARVFEDINAGIDAGFKLVDTNPINLVFLKMAEMDKYINAHVALQAMEESGLVELIPAGEKMPDGYSDISGKYGMVTKRAHQDGTTGEAGEMKSYRYIAREDVAQVFNNYLSQNLYQNKYIGKPFNAYMKTANTLNQFQLGVFSAFHAGFTSLEAVISHTALGIKALTRGDFQEAGKYFKHAPAAWYLNPKLGDKVMKAWMGDPAAAKEMPQIVQWLEMAGARRIMDSRFQTDQTQKMFQAWGEGNKIGAAVRTIPAIVEQSARPILEWLVPRQKFGVFAEMANDWSHRNPNASHEATRKAMQQIWNRVDSRLGQVVYDRLFVHNVAKNLTQALIRAPGWTGGTILEVGGGLKDLATYGKDLTTKGKQAELSDRAAYTLSLMTVTAISNVVLTALFTGEPPQDWKDLLAFRTGGKDEKGNPERFMLPTYAKDIYAYAQKPGTTLMHKTHPLLSMIGDLANNKDYYGTEIRHQGDNPIMQLMQAGKFTVKAFIPFWMKGTSKEFERGGSIAAMAAPLIGIMPAPADLNKTEAERLASQLVSDRMPKGTKTQEQFERSQLVQHLTGLARRDKAQAQQEIRQALKSREITMLQAQHVFQNARLAPIQVAFKRLSYEEAQRVYEVATEEEKRKLRYLMGMKKHNHLKAGNII